MLKLGSEVIEQAVLDQYLSALRIDYLSNIALLKDNGRKTTSTHYTGQGIAFV